MKTIKHELFDAFLSKLTEASIYTKYAMGLIKKAKPSDGIGDYHGNKKLGISIYSRFTKIERDEINGIFLHGKGHKGYEVFAGELPLKINFANSRTEIHAVLGKPDWSIEKGGVGIMAITNNADKWYTANNEGFRIEYATDDNSISLISIHCAKQEAEWA